MRLRAMSLVLAAVGLSGCGIVTSPNPLFQQGATVVRPGLWAGLEGAECAIPTDARLATWPACAKPMVVKGNLMTSPSEKDGKIGFVLSDTAPAILQVELSDSLLGQPAPEPIAGTTPSSPVYLYAVARFGGARPVTDISFMPLDCPKKSIAGLKVARRLKNQVGDSNCTATLPAAVVTVAKTTLMEKALRMVWVADAPAP